MDYAADLDAAVRAGAITEDAARSLRNFSAERRGAPQADEERFVIVNGFSDVMTAIALLMLLGGTMASLFAVVGPFAFPVFTAVTWGLAEYFTRRRRLVLTSFVLFGVFVIGWTASCFAIGLIAAQVDVGTLIAAKTRSMGIPALVGMVTSAGAAMGCTIYWLRFKLPIAYTATVAAGLTIALQTLRFVLPDAPAWFACAVVFVSGVLTFVLAMWWDMTDIHRQTRRSDVAFWLHAMAGSQVAAASFEALIGYGAEVPGWHRLDASGIAQFSAGSALLTLLLFAFFSIVAVVIDRRSILFSSLVFVVPASAYFAIGFGEQGLFIAVAAVGFALLLVSWRWTSMRRTLLTLIPAAIRAQLPRTEILIARPRPVW